MKGQLYPPHLNRCLDDNMLDRMSEHGILHSIVRYEGQLAMDFKSDVNIHPWEKFANQGKEVCYRPE